MKNNTKSAVISNMRGRAEACLGNEMQDMETLIKTETETQIAKTLKALREDTDTLSSKDQKAKTKRDNGMINGMTAIGALVGVAMIGAAIISPPTGAMFAGYAASVAGTSFSTATLATTFASFAACATTALGRGLGVLQTKCTPFMPELSEEGIEDIRTKARQKIETEKITELLCKIRLERNDGRLSHDEFAQLCEAASDLAILRHKISEPSAQKLKQAAEDARKLAKDESEKQREEEKLELEKTKAKKEDERTDKKEALALKKVEQDMHLERVIAKAKIQQGNNQNALSDFMTKLLNGEDGGKPLDLSRLAMLQMLSGKNGGFGQAA